MQEHNYSAPVAALFSLAWFARAASLPRWSNHRQRLGHLCGRVRLWAYRRGTSPVLTARPGEPIVGSKERERL